MRHLLCPGETYCTITSKAATTKLMFRARSNGRVTNYVRIYLYVFRLLLFSFFFFFVYCTKTLCFLQYLFEPYGTLYTWWCDLLREDGLLSQWSNKTGFIYWVCQCTLFKTWLRQSFRSYCIWYNSMYMSVSWHWCHVLLLYVWRHVVRSIVQHWPVRMSRCPVTTTKGQTTKSFYIITFVYVHHLRVYIPNMCHFTSQLSRPMWTKTLNFLIGHYLSVNIPIIECDNNFKTYMPV